MTDMRNLVNAVLFRVFDGKAVVGIETYIKDGARWIRIITDTSTAYVEHYTDHHLQYSEDEYDAEYETILNEMFPEDDDEGIAEQALEFINGSHLAEYRDEPEFDVIAHSYYADGEWHHVITGMEEGDAYLYMDTKSENIQYYISKNRSVQGWEV